MTPAAAATCWCGAPATRVCPYESSLACYAPLCGQHSCRAVLHPALPVEETPDPPTQAEPQRPARVAIPEALAADVEPCTSRVRIAVYNGVQRVIRCQRAPHYAKGPHRASVVAEGTRAEDHPGTDPALHPADVTVEWSVE